ncbi:MAG: peptidoglycan-associated lipoprotein Pal [Candidatus Zixiibacteriota bacterium]
MKNFLLILGLIAVLVAVYGCGGSKPKPVTEEPVIVVDTTPPPPPPPPVEPPPPPPPVIKATDFMTVYFDFDKYTIRGDQRSALDNNVQVMKKFPDAVIKIEGHCDERGTVEYNLALGDKRANAVKEYLVAAGINAGRIETISYGKERPVNPGHDEAAWAKNRRAEFRVISK